MAATCWPSALVLPAAVSVGAGVGIAGIAILIWEVTPWPTRTGSSSCWAAAGGGWLACGAGTSCPAAGMAAASETAPMTGKRRNEIFIGRPLDRIDRGIG